MFWTIIWKWSPQELPSNPSNGGGMEVCFDGNWEWLHAKATIKGNNSEMITRDQRPSYFNHWLFIKTQCKAYCLILTVTIPWHFLTRQFLTPTIFQPTISHPTISHSTIYHPTISHFKYIILGQFLTPTIFQPTLSHQPISFVFCDNFSPNLSSPLRWLVSYEAERGAWMKSTIVSIHWERESVIFLAIGRLEKAQLFCSMHARTYLCIRLLL